MKIPQSVTQQLAQSQDTTAQNPTAQDSSGVDQAVNEFSNAFSEGLNYLLTGNWDALYDHLTTGMVDLLGVFTKGLFEAVAALVVLLVIYRLLYLALQQTLERSERIEPGLESLLQKTFRVVAFFFIGTIVLDQLGISVTGLIAGLSIAGVIAGFAARDSLENFISGVTILVDKPFRVGDYVEIDDEYGQVDEITLRSTRVRTVRNEIMVMPNTDMITQRVTNHTKRNVLRIDVPFGIAYKEWPDEAREVLAPLTEDDDRILSEPSPSVVVTEMSDSSVEMVFRFYTNDPSQELPLRWEYTEKVREALREAEIEIPFPHRQLFLDGAQALENTKLLESSSNGASAESDDSDE